MIQSYLTSCNNSQLQLQLSNWMKGKMGDKIVCTENGKIFSGAFWWLHFSFGVQRFPLSLELQLHGLVLPPKIFSFWQWKHQHINIMYQTTLDASCPSNCNDITRLKNGNSNKKYIYTDHCMAIQSLVPIKVLEGNFLLKPSKFMHWCKLTSIILLFSLPNWKTMHHLKMLLPKAIMKQIQNLALPFTKTMHLSGKNNLLIAYAPIIGRCMPKKNN